MQSKLKLFRKYKTIRSSTSHLDSENGILSKFFLTNIIMTQFFQQLKYDFKIIEGHFFGF